MPIKKALPTYYYLDHFHEFLTFFDGPSGALLDAGDRRWIEAFRALSQPQQCLVVRFANRKYPLVKREQLTYAEIADIAATCDTLIELGWLSRPEQIAASLLHAHWCCQAMNKADIQRLLTHYAKSTSTSVERSGDKAQLSSHLRNAMAVQWPATGWLDEWLWFVHTDWLNYLLFLFFGNCHGRLNQFSMRDLGVMNTRGDNAGDAARFSSAQDAQLAYQCAQALQHLSLLDDTALWSLATTLAPLQLSGSAAQWRARFLYHYGEQRLATAPEQALQLWAWADSDKAWERWLREQYKRGAKSLVEERLRQLIDEGASEHLITFAEDFYARKFQRKKTSVWTDWLRQTNRTIAIDESYLGNVESGVVRHYQAQGMQVWRTENQCWRDLFTLVFWPLLTGPEALVTEFDRLPLTLRENRFYDAHAEEIESLLAAFNTTPALIQHLQQTVTTYYGHPCCLIHWREGMLSPLTALCEHTSLPVLQGWLRRMCVNFRDYQDGYPDIMLLRLGRLCFEEIKAPGDQLRRNQLVTLRGLREQGFDVTVVPVSWVQDPLQPYVVVDIETTGGRSDAHRITEVGLV